MEVLYGNMNGLSFAISPVVKFRETYIGPYILQGDEVKFGKDAPIEEEIKNNENVLGYVVRTKTTQLDEVGYTIPIFVDNYFLIGEEKGNGLKRCNSIFKLESGDLFQVGDPNSHIDNYGVRVICCESREKLLTTFLRLKHNVFDYLADGNGFREFSKQFVKKNLD